MQKKASEHLNSHGVKIVADMTRDALMEEYPFLERQGVPEMVSYALRQVANDICQVVIMDYQGQRPNSLLLTREDDQEIEDALRRSFTNAGKEVQKVWEDETDIE